MQTLIPKKQSLFCCINPIIAQFDLMSTNTEKKSLFCCIKR